jgi:hypothetical protein
MGFLNHSVNNIIVDATLTEKGREYLSKNEANAFNITQYAFGDDEVDYSVITRYGIQTGKEKIEKNTPIFEASTSQNLSLKFPLLSRTFSSDLPMYLPRLITENNAYDNIELTAFDNTRDYKNITLKTVIEDATTDFELQSSLVDTDFKVYYDTRFISLYNNTTLYESNSTQKKEIAYTVITPETVSEDFIGQKKISNLKVKVSPSLSSTVFTKYSISDVIRTQLYIVGRQSTAKKVIPVRISLV